MVSIRENHIVFPVDFHLVCVREGQNKIMELVEFRGFENVILDFSNVRTCFSDAIIPIAATVSKLREEGVGFQVIAPNDLRMKKMFGRHSWLHIMDSRNFSPGEDYLGNITAKIFKSAKDQDSISNGIMGGILKNAKFLQRKQLRALEWAIYEIMDNCITHCENGSPGVVELSHKPMAKEIQLIVSDCGIGIPESLRRGLKKEWTDQYALEQAIKEGVTRGTGQGNGLFGTIRVAEFSRGAFSINSGNAFLALSRDGHIISRNNNERWLGTSIDFTFNYGESLALEKALSFKGKIHEPMDTIDFEMESGDGLIINLKDISASTGNRYSGYEARNYIKNIFLLTEKNIILNCSEVSLMSSSYADELFSKIYLDLRDIAVKDRLSIIGLNDLNISIIERSFLQRTLRNFREELNVYK